MSDQPTACPSCPTPTTALDDPSPHIRCTSMTINNDTSYLSRLLLATFMCVWAIWVALDNREALKLLRSIDSKLPSCTDPSAVHAGTGPTLRLFFWPESLSSTPPPSLASTPPTPVITLEDAGCPSTHPSPPSSGPTFMPLRRRAHPAPPSSSFIDLPPF